MQDAVSRALALLKSCAVVLWDNTSSSICRKGQMPKFWHSLSGSLGAVGVGTVVEFWIHWSQERARIRSEARLLVWAGNDAALLRHCQS